MYILFLLYIMIYYAYHVHVSHSHKAGNQQWFLFVHQFYPLVSGGVFGETGFISRPKPRKITRLVLLIHGIGWATERFFAVFWDGSRMCPSKTLKTKGINKPPRIIPLQSVPMPYSIIFHYSPIKSRKLREGLLPNHGKVGL